MSLTHHLSTVGRGCGDRLQDCSARLPEVLQVVIVISVVNSVVALLGQSLIPGGRGNSGLHGEGGGDRCGEGGEREREERELKQSALRSDTPCESCT